MLGEITLLFIGAVIGWATSVYGSRVSEKSNLIGDHIKDLMNYSEKLWQHWCASYVEDRKTQAEEIAKIRTMYISINSFYEHHAQELFDHDMIIIYNKWLYGVSCGRRRGGHDGRLDNRRQLGTVLGR